MNEQNRYARSFGEQCTPRALVTGALGAVVITASSMYVALRMGALPWPTIFVAILSLTVLKALGRTNLNEINVTHTAMSAGGMVAGAGFHAPGWMLDGTPRSTPSGDCVTVSGALLGVVFTALIRGTSSKWSSFRSRWASPPPRRSRATRAAARQTPLLDAGSHGCSPPCATGSAGFRGLDVGRADGEEHLLRRLDRPMAVGIGYIIGPLYGVWFLGALLAYFGIIRWDSPSASSRAWTRRTRSGTASASV